MVRHLLQDGWRLRRLGEPQDSAIAAQVPGWNWADLARAGADRAQLEQSDEEDWVYETEFLVSELACSVQVLKFNGLDTFATIRLNGELLGHSSNAFLPVEFDVTGRLLVGLNRMEIEFSSAVRVAREGRESYLQAEGLPEDMACFDERAFVRRPQFSFGWDFSPRRVGCGITGDVELLCFDRRFLDFSPSTHWLDDGSVRLESNARTEGEGRLLWRIPGIIDAFRLADEPLVLPKGSFALWPSQTTFAEFAFADDLVPVATGSLPLRKIELEQEPDLFGESFRFVLNGERVVARGINVVPSFLPMDRPLGPMDPYSSLRDLPAGFNMVRIWGGGGYLPPAAMAEMDRRGILVWHDFASACSYLPEEPGLLASFADEARHHVRRLRQHPSLAIWCGNNENLMMHQGRWGGEKNVAERYYGEQLFEQELSRIVQDNSPEIPYISSSPVGSKGDPKTTIDAEGEPIGTCNEASSGDCHYWDVWHGRGDWEHYRDCRARFVSEFGFPSWSRIEGDEAWMDDANRTGKPHQAFLDLLYLHQPESTSAEELRFRSQLNQRDAMRLALIEMLGNPACDGALAWQWNDVADGLSWAWTGPDGVPKIVAQWIANQVDGFGFLRLGEFKQLEAWVLPFQTSLRVRIEEWRDDHDGPILHLDREQPLTGGRLVELDLEGSFAQDGSSFGLWIEDRLVDWLPCAGHQPVIWADAQRDGTWDLRCASPTGDLVLAGPGWRWLNLDTSKSEILEELPEFVWSPGGLLELRVRH